MVGISNNYYLLNNELESDKYYQMAIDLAMKKQDDELLALFLDHVPHCI